jgi:hypothetical protein
MNQQADLLRQRHSVKVNNGSGVLIQSMSPEYAYVLTAKHCLKVDSEDLESDFIQPQKVFANDGTEINILDVICHDNEDIAVIIVTSDSTPTLDLMINCDYLKAHDDVFLCGYPDARRQTDNEYLSLIYNFSHTFKQRLILTPKASGIVQDNIVGFSGGGIFTFGDNDSPVLLCGIETKMDGNPKREHHGSISVIPISEFELLINNSHKLYLGNALSPLLPLHLSSFKHLINHSFTVSNSWAIDHRLDFLKERLKEVATENVEVNLFPQDILDKFKGTLKVHSRPKCELRSRDLWVALLELLTISILIDKPKTIDTNYVEKMLQSRKLVFIGVNETWQQHITDIFKAELISFDNGGIVVAKTFSSQREVQFSQERVKKLIDNKHIARPPKCFRSVANSNSNISKINSIVDLGALHAECIEIKESLYEELTDITTFDEEKYAELRAVLAKEYGTYLTVKDSSDE